MIKFRQITQQFPVYNRQPIFVQFGHYWCVWMHTPWWSLGLFRDDFLPPLFSERYGYTKAWRMFGLKLSYRPRNRK